MNLLSSIVLGVALLGVALVVNGTLNHNYDNTRPLAQEVTEQQRPINISEIMNLKGTVVSLQNDDSGAPEWILSGRWQIEPITGNNTNTSSSSDIKFTSTITMTSIDGTKSHKHRLTDFALSNMSIQNRTAIIKGTNSLVTSEDNFGLIDKRLDNMPLVITIMNLKTIKIDLDNNSVKQHFGNSPIYGKVG